MRLRRMIFLEVIALLAAFSLPAAAHHGYAAYDETKKVTLKGTVTEFAWANPHTQIYFDVKNATGTIAHWGCETLNPSKLLQAGWTERSVKPGDHVTITLVPARNGSPVGILRKLVLDDTGRQLVVQDSPQ
jgi:ABC-type oligopeptide transport system substrate-binding subunit